MKRAGFTMVELLVVVGLICIIAAIMFPAIKAQMESARIDDARSEFRVIEAALAAYNGRWGGYPGSSRDGWGDNAGNELMLAALRSATNGGPFVNESIIKRWVGDSDGDGRQEIQDPWRNPWIYFHPTDAPRGAARYIIEGRPVSVEPVKKGDVYVNMASYQMWSCGSNRTDESGQGDDIGNVRQ